MVELGPYDLEQHHFTDCVLDVGLSESAYTRMDYLSRLHKSD